MRNHLFPILIVAGISLFLSSCSSQQEAPIGIGSGTDDLKESPCANCDRPVFYVNGRWIG